MQSLERRQRVLISIALFEGGLALLAVIVGWLLGFAPTSRLHLSAEHLESNLAAIGWGVGATIPMVASLLILERIPLPFLRRLRVVVDRLVAPLFERATLSDLALVSLMAGLGEEVLFRGLLQDGIEAGLGGSQGIWIAILVASICFGLAHSITRTYVVLATLTGVYLGCLHVWTDNLLAPITAHAAYDFFALVYLTRRLKP